MDPALAADIAAGLTAFPRRLSCRWFYDAAGARLFEEICALPEYYLTRAEQAILNENRREIVAAIPPGGTLLELGSGNGQKTRTLLDAILDRDGRARYVAIDISAPTLIALEADLRKRYPSLWFEAIVAEYRDGLARVAAAGGFGRKLVLWLGSNVGNLDRADAARFLASVDEVLDAGDGLLVGIDLRKDPATLIRAYDDARGVTARFNKNLLRRINDELGGDFDVDSFDHRATYDVDAGRIQMHLVSRRRQRATIRALALTVDFEAGEAVHTEDSYKYSLEEIETLANAAGLAVARQWLDDGRRFAVTLFRRAAPRLASGAQASGSDVTTAR